MEKEFFPMTVPFDRAKTLVADSPCYALADVERIFGVGVRYTPEQRTALKNIPFSEEVLKACAGTHMLFPGFPMSLLDIRENLADLFYAKVDGWYAKEEQTFSRATVQIRWHLLRMEPVPDSFNKNWSEQKQLLSSDEEVPSAALVAFATMLHFKATKQRLLEHCFVRASDVDSDGNRVCVGYFGAGGFAVACYWDAYRFFALGLSSAQRSEPSSP